MFGYFFYWTVHEDFPPAGMDGPGVFWPSVAGIAALAAWVLMLAARRLNAMGSTIGLRAAIAFSGVLAALGGAALL